MRANRLKTVLCVGNGISQEPRALARAGFDVTALDLSPYATEVARGTTPPDELLEQLVGGRPRGEHGTLQFVVGDLRDSRCCPGPYDVIVERKTLQLYPEAERPMAMRSVADRLGSPGILFSHAHDGRWRFDQPRIHLLESWFRAEGWPIWEGDGLVKGRVAWPLLTTG
jgi:2-polyprenyl-3-methyl-5-hydroxy-6-metoxy-1,4-benzoquinol methylase